MSLNKNARLEETTYKDIILFSINMSLSNNSEQTELLNQIIKGQSGDAWESFSNWIHCICVVTFDLELGQALEVRILTSKIFKNKKI